MTMRLFSQFTVLDPAGHVVYTPFVADDGRVGYRVGRTDDRADAETFIYFNPSTTERDTTPNVFVYIGGDNDPAHDEPQHFYALDREAFGLDAPTLPNPCSVVDAEPEAD